MSRKTMRGNIAMRFLTSAPADLEAPTVTELAAGTDILHGAGSDGECLADLAGWDVIPTDIPAPDACSLQTQTIEGETQLGTGTLTYYLDDSATPIKDLLTVGTVGWVVLMPLGETAGQHATVAKVTVNKNAPDYQVQNQPATFTVSMSKQSQTEGVVTA